MKKIALAIVLLLSLMTVSGCKEKAIYKNFETNYSFKVTVPANSLLGTALLPAAFEEESNSEQQYSLNDTRKDLIEEVFVQSFLLEVVSPSTEDLSFLNSARFHIDSDGLAEMLVAEKDPVPNDVGQDLLFDVMAVNLAPYLRADAFNIRSQFVTDESRNNNITLRGSIRFAVKAKVF
jgi:hypothetical protein